MVGKILLVATFPEQEENLSVFLSYHHINTPTNHHHRKWNSSSAKAFLSFLYEIYNILLIFIFSEQCENTTKSKSYPFVDIVFLVKIYIIF